MMRQIEKKKKLIALIVLGFGMISSSCSMLHDNKPPSAPLLTIEKVTKNSVSLAWSESYDNVGVSEYKIYRNGEVLDEVEDTEYKDNDVEEGNKYEYYVVAYDKAGNRSSRSTKQTVTVEDAAQAASNGNDEPTATPENKDQPGDKGTGSDLNKLAKSTVRIYMLDDDYNVVGTGSGTIMNKQGYILTNYHVVGTENGLNNKEGYVAVALTDDVRANTQPQYFARFRSGVRSQDLAVVQITEDINGNPVNPEDLKLSPVKTSDSDKIEIGDEISILGYPGVGGDTITFTSGKISGFIDEDGDNTVDWVKTDALVNHGNSGGTALNDKGEMIGVPSAKLPGEDNDVMFFLKPVNLAMPILEDAMAQGDNPQLPPRADPGKNSPGSNTDGTVADITGRIVDAYTNEPLLGAAFVILAPGVTVDEFVSDPQDSMILSYAETDADGFFYCSEVPTGAIYAVIVGADGYQPLMYDDGLEIPADATGVQDIGDITLEANK